MPEPLVELIAEDPRWEEMGLAALAERAGRAVLVAAGRDPDRHEVSLLGADDARIAALNAEFRGKDRPTNVLSWPAFEADIPEPDEEALFLGDMALAFETCAREAAEAGIPMTDHVTHLVVHGLLHLLGYDHEDEVEAEAMEDFEVKVLASMGLPNPYSRQERP